MVGKSLSWTPVRCGKLYCSPACGGRCTRSAYDEAVRTGKRLARRLGKGWTYEVWENTGWFVKAISACGNLKVHLPRHGIKTYSAFLGEPRQTGGRWVEHGKTPELAIRAVIRVAKKERDWINGLLAGYENLGSGVISWVASMVEKSGRKRSASPPTGLCKHR